ncbi:MAG: glycosyltransferase [Verrucomicrobiota bacterium]|nr:glycosyltransferase [Verrucomicrobiota bacterium]
MSNVLVTSFNSKYFKAGLTLLAGVHRTSYDVVDKILIYDLGLTEGQKRLLRRCEKVEVRAYPPAVDSFFSGYLDPGQHAYKTGAVKFAGEHGSLVLWLDAGAMPARSLGVIFGQLAADGIFLVQDEHANACWTHERAFQLMQATTEERSGRQLCSGILGYAAGGRYQGLIDEAYEFGQNPDIVCGPHENHRHDRSIYSVLAVRHNCQKRPWEVFGEFRGLAMSADQVIYAHRGKHHDVSGLKVRWERDFSVCLTVCNAGERIERVLDGLAQQRGVRREQWEVVLVDNNSNDSSLEKVRSFVSRIPCDTKIVREERQGSFSARRRAAREARGRILGILDDDIVLDQHWIQNCLRFFADHEKAGIVCGRIDVETPGPLPTCWDRVRWMYGVRDYMDQTEKAVDLPGRMVQQPCGGGTAVRALPAMLAYETEEFVASGRIAGQLGSGEDMELAWRIVRQGWESWYAPALTAMHMIPSSRLSAREMARLRFSIAAGNVAIRSLQDTGRYPRSARSVTRSFWWALASLARRVNVLAGRAIEDRLVRSGIAGHISGLWHEWRRAVRRAVGR